MELPPIAPVRTPAELAEARGLFQEYAAGLGFDLCFQGFDEELATLPGAYAPPRGEILLAPGAGVVAVRPMSERGVCEMKRMYVRPAFRGSGLGRRLAEAIVAVAKERGYERMRLDTIGTMTAAMTLYRSLGFREIAAYYANPIPGAVYFEKTIR